MDQGPEDRLREALGRLPAAERPAWIAELTRLVRVVGRYGELRPKRQVNPATGRYQFTPAVEEFCREAACGDPVVLRREPHRRHPPSPYTLDDWLRAYHRDGVLAFVRRPPDRATVESDRRRARVSPAAAQWVNDHWRRFHGPRPLYRAWQREARKQNWIIPGEQWLYRRWRGMPSVVRTRHRSGSRAWESRHAPYVPRDVTDLAALQVLCGDQERARRHGGARGRQSRAPMADAAGRTCGPASSGAGTSTWRRRR